MEAGLGLTDTTGAVGTRALVKGKLAVDGEEEEPDHNKYTEED